MSAPLLKVQQGYLRGASMTTPSGTKYFSFSGIPFAKPPIGDLRFKDPEAIDNWHGILDATKEGNKCPQVEMFGDRYSGDEDCLYLNVHTPSLPAIALALLPVMVLIPGGGYVRGSGTRDEVGPDYIVEQDVILVTMNYRLGVLGFLCLETPEAPGNMALKDVTLALKWVQQNIKSFNGDPDNVTGIGFSAGGAALEFQFVTPLAKGLFHKSILQSSSILNFWARNKNYKQNAKQLVKILGGNCSEGKEMASFLKSIDVEKLVRASLTIINDDSRQYGDLFAFTPVVCSIPGHENFFTEEPEDIFKSGDFISVPTIAGCVEKEGIFIQPFYQNELRKRIEDRNFTELLPKQISIDKRIYHDTMKNVYAPRSTDKNVNDFIYDFISDITFVSGIFESLRYRLKKRSNNYVYRFTYDRRENDLNKNGTVKELGATHGDDTNYIVTNSYGFKESPQGVEVRKMVVNMWTNFAKTGNPSITLPNVAKTPWLPMTEKDFNILEIGTKLTILKSDPWPERTQLWKDLYNKIKKENADNIDANQV